MCASSPRQQFSNWQDAFNAAVASGQLGTAKEAIMSRLRIKATHPPSILERIALNDAIHLLRTLRDEKSSSEMR